MDFTPRKAQFTLSIIFGILLRHGKDSKASEDKKKEKTWVSGKN